MNDRRRALLNAQKRGYHQRFTKAGEPKDHNLSVRITKSVHDLLDRLAVEQVKSYADVVSDALFFYDAHRTKGENSPEKESK